MSPPFCAQCLSSNDKPRLLYKGNFLEALYDGRFYCTELVYRNQTMNATLKPATYRGFTLIELLVVVLIIGILSSIALPQYQKAVAKSQATQALITLKSVAQAYTAYSMANGEWAPSFDALDIQVPWNGTTEWKTGLKATRSSQDWSLQLQWIADNGNIIPVIYMGRLTGPYRGSGFAYFFGQWDHKENWKADPNIIYCVEQIRGTGAVFSQEEGTFCKKVIGAERLIQAGDTTHFYQMP